MAPTDKVQLLQRAAFFTHGFQGAAIFILWILCLVVKAQKNQPGNINVLFAMCFLSVPVIIYVAMTPRWPRTVKWSHPIAQGVLCFVSSIIFFAGFITLSVANNNAIEQSKVKEGESKSCATVPPEFGTETGCNVSRGAVGLGVIVFLAFLATTGMYGYTCWWLRNNNLPFTSHLKPHVVAAIDVEATTQDAFSHKDDHHVLDPEDEHDRTHASPAPVYQTGGQGGGVYAPLTGAGAGGQGGNGRYQGDEDDYENDYRRDSREDQYRNQHNASAQSYQTSQGGGRQTPYQDQPAQQVVEFPDGPYGGNYRY